MRTLLLAPLLTLALTAAAATAPCCDPRWNMRANDPSYAEATDLAKYLTAQHLAVRCITGTTIGSQLLGYHSAALHTDHGSISVVFFPAPKGAEQVTTELSVNGDHYRYRFTSHEGWLPRHDTIDLDGPLTFLVHGKWLIFVWDTITERVVNAALKGKYCDTRSGAPTAARTFRRAPLRRQCQRVPRRRRDEPKTPNIRLLPAAAGRRSRRGMRGPSLTKGSADSQACNPWRRPHPHSTPRISPSRSAYPGNSSSRRPSRSAARSAA